MSNNKHLLLFTLGPVQSFIAQARKTQDLYAGSKLLSDLIKLAILKVGESNLIFPEIGDAMPNRFLAYVPADITDYQKFGEGIEKAVRQKWQQIADDTLLKNKPIGFDEQINSHLEIFWVIEELRKSYADTVKSMEKQLAAVKNIRPFSQFNYAGIKGERGRKCSLDGQRNALFTRERTNDNGIKTLPAFLAEGIEIINERELSEGEGLSAISFVKRFYKNASFDSTADIALKYSLQQIEDEPMLKTCIALIQDANSQLFYEESVREDTLKKYLREANKNEESANSYKECSDKIRTAVKAKGLSMQKYYAILTFDGDDMGKWLAGQWLAEGKDLEEFHRKFAIRLSAFAKEAKKEVDKVGRTVYAGGDDFLGFVNLYYLLPVLKRLRGLFREMVNDPLSEFRNGKEIAFTAGICIAHYKEPLSLVLDSARDTQKRAKDLDHKNALGITVIKGSGESHTAVVPFGAAEINVDIMKKLLVNLIDKDFSNTFIKTQRLGFERLFDFNEEYYPELEDMFNLELKRVLVRSALNKNWGNEDKKREAESLWEKLLVLHDNKPDNFFQILHISDFLQRNMDTSNTLNELQTV